MEREAVRQRRPVFGGKQLVRLLDSAVEDASADAVPLAWLLADATGENEVVRLAPLGGELVFAEELDKLGVKDDLADPSRRLRRGDVKQSVVEIDIAPAQVGQLRDTKAAAHDRGGDQHPMLARRAKQNLNLLAGQPRTSRLGLLQLLNLRLDRVVVDQVVADCGVEDLTEPRQRLVDRPVRERPFDLALLALADLCRLVAIGLVRGDLRQAVVLEEGQQVMGQRQLVVLDGAGGELVAAGGEPFRSELVERRLGRCFVACLVGSSGLPDASPHIGENVRQLLLSPPLVPTFLGGAEAQVAALAIGAEAQAKGLAALPLPHNHLSRRRSSHRCS